MDNGRNIENYFDGIFNKVQLVVYILVKFNLISFLVEDLNEKIQGPICGLVHTPDSS